MEITTPKKIITYAVFELALYVTLLTQPEASSFFWIKLAFLVVSLSSILFSRCSQIAALATVVLVIAFQIPSDHLLEKTFSIWHSYVSIKYIGLTATYWYQINKKGKDSYAFPYRVSSLMLSITVMLSLLKSVF